ncbi:MAG: DUF433 domain-containing protein [Candidatus Anammoxibacter sp.]
MNEDQLLKRITSNPKIMVGKPVINGTRLTVEHILNLMAHGDTIEKILEEYNGLKIEDIRACLLFATKSLEEIAIMPMAVGNI